jgi:transcriptional regulator with XRE-family HTH domain
MSSPFLNYLENFLDFLGRLDNNRDMKDRLIKLRKSLHLTQGAFGQKVGLTDPMISLFESGKKIPQDSTIKLICYAFGVREDWLRYGIGEMMNPTLADDKEERLLSMFRTLSPEMKQVVLQKIDQILSVDKSWETSSKNEEIRSSVEVSQKPNIDQSDF